MGKYAKIEPFEVRHGKNCGVSIFVQGCNNHCKGCFNPETWDFNGGKEWTQETEGYFLSLLNKPFIKRSSILGGEPLAYENLPFTLYLVELVKKHHPDMTIWLWTGYDIDKIIDEYNTYKFTPFAIKAEAWLTRMEIIKYCDFIIDGPFIEEQKDLTLAFRGSTNQRVIDVKKTLDAGEIILYDSNNI